MLSFLWFLLIGLAAGWLAGKLTRGSGYGLVGDLVVGVIGSMVGGVLFGLLGLRTTNTIGGLVTATVGAIAFLFLLGYLKQRKA